MRAPAIRFISAAIAVATLLSVIPGPSRAQEQRHSFAVERLPLRQALDSLMQWYGVSIIYLDRDAEGFRVTATGTGADLQEALDALLAATPLEWIRTGGQVVLRRRPEPERRPSGTICGFVRDSLTGSGIGDAVVLVRAGERTIRWVPANSYGFFSLADAPTGDLTLAVRAVGYGDKILPAGITPGVTVRCDVDLPPQAITLQEVTVEGLRSAPAPAEGFARGIFIRSAPSDRQQFLLDGVRIYNPAHFGETISTFSSEALNDVEVMQGALPPDYGGRIGGVLDLSMRDGARDRLRGTAAAGSQGLSGSLEGPLGEKVSFLFSARRGYPEPWIPMLESHGVPARAGADELLARTTFRLSGSSRLSAGGYWNRDFYANRVEGAGRGLSNAFRWGNQALHLRWWGIVSPATFVAASGSITQHRLSLEHRHGGAALPVTSGQNLEDLTLRVHAEQYTSGDHLLRGGVELVRHALYGTINGFSSQQSAMVFPEIRAWEFSLFLQDQWSMLDGLRVDLGGRLSTFSSGETTFSSVDPRVSARLTLDERTTLVGAVSAVRQFLHPYRHGGVFLLYPVSFWYPSSAMSGPTTALHMTLGGTRQANGFEAGFDLHVRFDSQLHGPLPAGTGPSGGDGVSVGTGIVESGTVPVVTGSGRSYGIGITLQRRFGNPTAAIRYSWSKAEQRFAGVNGGRYAPSPFDRRHELQTRILVEPATGWTLGLLAVIATADPRVAPAELRSAARAVEAAAAFADAVDLGGSQSPGFQRLQLSLQRGFDLDGRQVRLSLTLMNGYGLLDPFRWELTGSDDPRKAWVAGVEEIPLFPLYPMLSLSLRF